MAGLMDELGKAVDKLQDLGGKAVDGAKDLFEKAKPGLEETFDKVSDGAKDLIEKARPAVADALEKVSDGAKNLADKARADRKPDLKEQISDITADNSIFVFKEVRHQIKNFCTRGFIEPPAVKFNHHIKRF